MAIDDLDSKSQLRQFIESVVDQHPALASLRTLQSQQLVPVDGKQRKWAMGSSTLTWTAATQSAVRTVTHGLGVVPVVVLLTFRTSGVVLSPHHQNDTTTTFDAFGNATGAITATVTFDWLAIG